MLPACAGRGRGGARARGRAHRAARHDRADDRGRARDRRSSRRAASAAGSSGRSSSCSARSASAFVHVLLSVKREFDADELAAGLCGSPHGLADGLIRLEQAAELLEFQASTRHRAAVHDQPVPRGGSRGAVRHSSAGRRAGPPAARARSGLARQVCARLRSPETSEGPVRGLRSEFGGDLLSRGLAPRVPSALAGLTALFGMGRGVPPPL